MDGQTPELKTNAEPCSCNSHATSWQQIPLFSLSGAPTLLASMSSQPPTKKAKTISHNHSAPVTSDGRTNIHLSQELIARIATYADMSNSGVMNICLAVGPIAARPIRISYLKKNVKYLNRTLKELLIVRRHANESFRRDKAGSNHREWMEVNADWKTIATSDADITAMKNVLIKDAIQSGDHPFLAFNNAAFAVELGLIDVVKF